MTVDVVFSAIAAPLDDRLSPNDRQVMATIAAWHNADDLTEMIHAGEITLDALCRRLPRMPRPLVFHAVANLEDLGYLPLDAIR